MKKWIVTIFVLFMMYSIYYDVTYGTVFTASEKVDIAQPQVKQNDVNDTYILVEIHPGDTVLSILEEIQQGPIPVPISQAITDFKELNQLDPIHIQPQKTYKFPIYSVGDRPS